MSDFIDVYRQHTIASVIESSFRAAMMATEMIMRKEMIHEFFYMLLMHPADKLLKDRLSNYDYNTWGDPTLPIPEKEIFATEKLGFISEIGNIPMLFPHIYLNSDVYFSADDTDFVRIDITLNDILSYRKDESLPASVDPLHVTRDLISLQEYLDVSEEDADGYDLITSFSDAHLKKVGNLVVAAINDQYKDALELYRQADKYNKNHENITIAPSQWHTTE